MSEPGRPEVDFDVIIRSHNGFDNQLSGEALQDVYDIAVNSMDFGSGFLDTEQLGHLRQLGLAIGAPPLHYGDCHAECWYVPNVASGLAVSWTDANGNYIAAPVMRGPNPCTCGAMEGRDS